MMNLRIIFPLFLFVALIGCKDTSVEQQPQPMVHFKIEGADLGNPIELLYYESNYHLFYEQLKDSDRLNFNQWGHAQSPDLIHWEYFPADFNLDSTQILGKGCIVTDWNNTSGLGNENTPLIAIRELVNPMNQEGDLRSLTFSLSWSNDLGNTWEIDHNHSIVLEHFYSKISDVKIIWHEETQRWVMLILVGCEVRFYSSENLVEWEYISRFGEEIYLKAGNWTEVDLFPMEVEETSELKWILLISGDSGSPNEGSGIQYFIGDFDGYIYKTIHNKPKWVDHGSDVYAGVVLSDYLATNKPAFFIASVFNSIYEKFNINTEKSGVFSFPRELTLKERYHDYYLFSNPVKAIENIEKEKHFIKETKFSGNLKLNENQKLPVEIDLTFDVNNRLYLDLAEVFGVKLTNGSGDELAIGYHSQRRYFFIADPTIRQKFPETWDGFNYAPYVIYEPKMDIKLIIDQTSVELFALDGFVTLTRKCTVSKGWDHIELYTDNGTITLDKGTITELESVW